MGDWNQQDVLDLEELRSQFSCALRHRLKAEAPLFIGFVDELVEIVKGGLDAAHSKRLEEELKYQSPFATNFLRASGRRKLIFKHACSVDACSNEECVLCKNAIRRPCSPDNIFQSKYIREKEPISAKCGGDVYIELVDCGTGKLLKEDLNVNLHFVTATTFRNRRTTEVTNGFDSSQISHWVKNNLLETDSVIECAGEKLTKEGLKLTMKDGIAKIPSDIIVTVSMDLHMVAVPDVDTARITAAAVSPELCFISRRAGGDKRRSKDRPHVGDEVSALNDVGEKTAEKFKQKNIVTVGDFKQFLEREFPDQIAELGRYIKGASPEGGVWSKICDSARSAIDFDDFFRLWHYKGRTLYFCCEDGQIQWNGEVGEYRLGAYHVHDVEERTKLVKMARKDWKSPNHGNCWSLLDNNVNDHQQTKEVSRFVASKPARPLWQEESGFYTSAPPIDEGVTYKTYRGDCKILDVDRMSISFESLGMSGEFNPSTNGLGMTSLDAFRQTYGPNNSFIESLIPHTPCPELMEDETGFCEQKEWVWSTPEAISKGFRSFDSDMQVISKEIFPHPSGMELQTSNLVGIDCNGSARYVA